MDGVDAPANASDNGPLTETSSDRPVADMLQALREAASRVLERRFRVILLVRSAYDRMTNHSTVFSAVWDDLRTMLRLLVRWADRSYKRVSWVPLVLMVGALIYFVTPADVIPDALGAIGFVDDVTVITTVVERLRSELNRFRQWERRKGLPS